MKRTVLMTIYVLLSCFFHAQTDSLNYVYTKSCLDADCVKKAETVQYYDRLGRPFQTIDIKGTPLKKDMVSHIAYDQYGRPSKTYLPVPQQETRNGLVYQTPLTAASAVYGSEKIYAEQIIENSPLERVKQSFGTGMAWADKPVNYTYSTNISATEVKKYPIATTWVENRTDSSLGSPGYYAVNSLMKTSVTDEDGNTVTEYKNGKGQTVLVRKNDGTQDINTYYIYDQYDQLTYVIPPLASVIQNLSSNDLARLCYQYRYDGAGRLVEKKLPGKGWEYMVYNKADQLVMSQDSTLKLQGKWMFTKYDQFGRVVLTGITNDSSSRESLQTTMTSAATLYETRSTTSFTVSGMQVYYTNNALPATMSQILSINYYDTYPAYSFNPAMPTAILGAAVLTDNASANGKSTKGMPVMSLVKNIENDNWTKDYIWYDEKGRAIGSYSINHLGGYTQTQTEIDFSGIVKRSITRHKRLSSDTERVITETFEYDDRNRLTVHKHKVDNNAEEILSRNTYNELSQLTNKKVGGTSISNPLESIDYAYNIRGWLTKINDPKNLGGKLFGYEIKYNQVEGLETPNSNYTDLKVKPRYNGNIAEVDWKTATTSSDYLRRYGYVYDKLNRLSAGFYQKDNNPSAQEYFEKMDYDVNGNITNLQRSASLEQNFPVASKIDNLTYIYSGNRLSTVTDSSTDYRGYPDVSGSPISYYEETGNMKDHIDKGILQIDYNFLNLPNYVKFDNTYIPRFGIEGLIYNVNTKYIYRADGTKLQKIYTYGTGGRDRIEESTITQYLDGFQYEIVDTGAAYSSIPLQFVPTAEGYYDFEKNKYIYSYTDHLGNVRLSYFKNTSGSAEVLEENNYYPFGLKHEDYNPTPGNPAYKYQYGGKELQSDTGWSDFGARMYMADIGRWGAMDPLAESNHDLTTYRYGFNNPVMFTDPNGMLEKATIDKVWNLGGGWTNTGDGFESNENIKIGYDGSYLSLNTKLEITDPDDVDINLPELVLNGYGRAKHWGGAISTYNINHGILYNGIDAMRVAWNKAVFDANQPFKPVLHNGSAYMMGGDMFGISDLVGLGLSRVAEDHPYAAVALSLAAIVATKGRATDDVLKTEGKIIGLGIDADLTLHRGSGAIIYEYGAWQKAGLTTVDWGKASIDKYHFRSSFREAAENAAGIRFEVTNFNPSYHKPGITNFEFDHILSNPALLQKTTFIKGGNEVIWTGTQFINK